MGSAGLTAIVRCVCGTKVYLSLEPWRRRGFTICDGCKSIIVYGSLTIVNADEAEEFFTMIVKQGEEREALRVEVEQELRRFVRAFDGQPKWMWSPATVRMVQAIRPKLEQLGGRINPGQVGDDGATLEAAYRGVEGAALLDEELRDEKPTAAS